MLLLSLLSYADRSVLAILSPTILADLHITATQYGYAVLVFSVCYMAANPLWGYWVDRRGVWGTVLLAVVLWSLASGSHALMLGLGGMCLARGVLGFGEGATFPAGLAVVTETLPEDRRGFGLGLAFSGGSLGAVLAPLLITPVALRFGWRAAFFLTALLGLVWIGIWVWLRASSVYAPQAAPLRLPRASVGRWNRNLVATAAAYGLGAAPLAFGLYAAPLYLSRVLHVSQAQLGHLLWIPPAGWEAGFLFWGWVSDRRRGRGAGRPGELFAAFCVAGFVVALAPLAAQTAYPVLATTAIFFTEMFIAGGFIVLALADGATAQRKENSGFLAGVSISCWALVTGTVTPVLGHFFDQRQYVRGFWLVALLPVLGTILWSVLRCDPAATVRDSSA